MKPLSGAKRVRSPAKEEEKEEAGPESHVDECCPICYEDRHGDDNDDAFLRTRCGHEFHRKCLADALYEQSRRLDEHDNDGGYGHRYGSSSRRRGGHEDDRHPAHPNTGWLAQTCPVCRCPMTSSSTTGLWHVLGGDPSVPLHDRIPLDADAVSRAVRDAANTNELILACMEWQGGITLLHLAMKRGLADRDAVEALVVAGSSNLEARTHGGGGGKTPFVEAAWAGHLDLCKWLRDLGADVQAADDQGAGAVVAAIYRDDTDLFDWLVALPCTDVHRRLTTNGASLLYLAAERGRCRMVTELIRRGADVDVACSDDVSHTPLWVARREGHEDVVEALLAAGA